ncbi:MAG TPA: 50S ribosomal protein L7/L12 [Candidatus Paceibacterota bacterium]|nr:50S ribosomal protein L7/L12 [Candidatus Paceibacterota bacterium]
MIESIEKMTVLELNELVKAVEKRFGVSAQAVAVAGPAAGGAAAEEKTEFGVELTAVGDQKIAVIKIVKEVLALGLAEAKTMVESAPVMLKADVKKEQAEEWKKKIEEAGGKVTLK